MIFFQVSFYRGKRTFGKWYYFIQNNISVISSTVQSFVVKSVADKSFIFYKSVLPKLVNFCSNEGIRFNFVTDSCNKCQFILTFPPISSPTK